MAYLIDSIVFIEAKNRHYGFDFCPAFWTWLMESNLTGCVFSIDRVKRELVERDDELANWTIGLDKGFFLSPNETSNRHSQDHWRMGSDDLTPLGSRGGLLAIGPCEKRGFGGRRALLDRPDC